MTKKRVATCTGCGKAHAAGTTCREGREAAWAMVKDKEIQRKHPQAYRWARGYLGLDEEAVA